MWGLVLVFNHRGRNGKMLLLSLLQIISIFIKVQALFEKNTYGGLLGRAILTQIKQDSDSLR